MKYRRLTEEERIHFEEDFKYFLIANGVTNEEWLAMNAEEPEKAGKLVDLFSDAVLDIVYKKLQFLEYRSDQRCYVFQLKEEEIDLMLLESVEPKVKLDTPEHIHHALKEHPEMLRLKRQSKAYGVEREAEIHQMISQGCVPSDQRFWDMIAERVK